MSPYKLWCKEQTLTWRAVRRRYWTGASSCGRWLGEYDGGGGQSEARPSAGALSTACGRAAGRGGRTWRLVRPPSALTAAAAGSKTNWSVPADVSDSALLKNTCNEHQCSLRCQITMSQCILMSASRPIHRLNTETTHRLLHAQIYHRLRWRPLMQLGSKVILTSWCTLHPKSMTCCKQANSIHIIWTVTRVTGSKLFHSKC